jgi:hypothetical protein
MVNTTYFVGGSLGVALLNTIAAALTASFLRSHPGGHAAQAVAAVHGYTIAFAVAAAIFAVAAILSLLLLGRADHTDDLGHRGDRPGRHRAGERGHRADGPPRTRAPPGLAGRHRSWWLIPVRRRG